MRVYLIAGARPNFMKIAPIYRASLKHSEIQCQIIHTGQHYDHEMSQLFFDELEIPAPTFNLEAGSGSHAVQTGKIMTSFEEICLSSRPDLVVVVGDVNSTLACSIVAKKLQIQVAHVEAGLRSFDLSMPEEINRMVTDAISDWFFVTEESGADNLLREGKSPNRIYMVGHVMIDNLLYQIGKINEIEKENFPLNSLKKSAGKYLFMTLHRPSNVDDRQTFVNIAEAVNELAQERTIFFPVHPRTRRKLEEFGIRMIERVKLLPPLGFRESLFLWKDAEAVLTDSGGLQEETTALSVPCITIRENTERPVTVDIGTNYLVGTRPEAILAAAREILSGKGKKGVVPPLWDGRAAERIVDIILQTRRCA